MPSPLTALQRERVRFYVRILVSSAAVGASWAAALSLQRPIRAFAVDSARSWD